MNYVDPSGEDAIVINRTVDTDDKYEKAGIEHMGALIQDEDGRWYYFFFGSTGFDYKFLEINYNDPFKGDMIGFWDLYENGEK